VAATRAAATEGGAGRNEISWRNEGNKAAVKLTEEREKKNCISCRDEVTETAPRLWVEYRLADRHLTDRRRVALERC